VSDLNPRFSFDSFVVGASNQTAASAARSAAESPGSVYNPLFIFGATGLGKTHLLQAIGLSARQVAQAPEVELLTLEEFCETLHAATAAGQIEAFRHRYAGVNVLLIDDMQFISGRRDAQAELLKIATEMRIAGRQLVITSDQAPGEIANLDSRLIFELSSGLVVDVTRPEYDTRLGILKRRAEERGAEFGPGVLEAAANVEVGNVRELIGALNRLVAFQAVSESPVTPAAAASMLTDLVATAPAPSARVSIVHDVSAVMDPNVALPELEPLVRKLDDDFIITGDAALMPDPPVMPQFSGQQEKPASAPPAPEAASRSPRLTPRAPQRPSTAQPAQPAPPVPPARGRPSMPLAPPRPSRPLVPPRPSTASPGRPSVPAAAPAGRPSTPRVTSPEMPPIDPKGDEFAQFLKGVESTVKRTVEGWKARLGEAILRWEGEGYQTSRLGSLLDQGKQHEVEETVQAFERDVEQLRSFQTEMTSIDPASAGHAVFRDPDRVREAAVMVERAREGTAPPPGPSGAWAFDGFRVGDSNRLAYNAALSVLETPGKRYNPLVLIGPPGVGKTHLLHGIGHALAAAPGALVACLSAQDYVDELMQADEAGRVEPWRSRYRRASAYLLDDLQLLAGKAKAQEELFNLFNYMAEEGRQLVFTMTGHPREVTGLDPRIVSRLEGGLVAAVERPDRDLRVTLVARLLSEKVGTLDPDLAEYLGSRPAESVRVLVGAVQRVVRAAESDGVQPDATFARNVLDGSASTPPRESTGVRTSGILATPLATIRSREKVVWRWPEAGDRLIEEL
jgi:chromosomal replication initiator protein DnaA